MRQFKALVVKSPYIERILAGQKTWEMRSWHNHWRGPVALIRAGSGLVLGVAEILDSIGPLSLEQRLSQSGKHTIPAERLQSANGAK